MSVVFIGTRISNGHFRFSHPLAPRGDPGPDLALESLPACLDSGAKLAASPDQFDGEPGDPAPFGLDFLPRFVDLLGVPNTGQGTLPFRDMGCYEKQP